MHRIDSKPIGLEQALVKGWDCIDNLGNEVLEKELQRGHQLTKQSEANPVPVLSGDAATRAGVKAVVAEVCPRENEGLALREEERRWALLPLHLLSPYVCRIVRPSLGVVEGHE